MTWGGDLLTPIVDNDVTRRDLEGHQGGFEDEEVPPGSEAESLVNIASSKANEWAGDGQVCDLSCSRSVHESDADLRMNDLTYHLGHTHRHA